MIFTSLITLLTITAFQVTTSQQQLEEPIRVRVALVPVDVIVIDKNGNPILDLNKNDFEILENGKLQTIDYFSLESYEGKTAEKNTQSSTADVFMSNPPNRIFLILFGRGHQTEFHFLERLSDFIEKDLLPTDQLAIMAYNRTTGFTTDHTALVDVLREFNGIQKEIERTLELRRKYTTPFYSIVNRIPLSLQRKIDTVFNSSEIPSRRILADKAIVTEKQLQAASHDVLINDQMIELAHFLRETSIERFNPIRNTSRFTSDGSLPKDIVFSEFIESRARSEEDISNLFSAIEYLRFVKGEKHLLFFSPEGLFLPRRETGDSIASLASDSRVRIHSFGTAGTRSMVDPGLDQGAYQGVYETVGLGGVERSSNYSVQGSFAIRSIGLLSNLSGGLSFLRDDPINSLRTINQATKSYYLLGYNPEVVTDNDSGFRRIEARVKRKDVDVYHRNGYYLRPDQEPVDLARFRIYARTVAAARYTDLVRDFTAELDLSDSVFKPGSTETTTAIRMHFDEKMVMKSGDNYTGQLVWTSFFLNDKQELKSQSWDTVRISLTKEQVSQLSRKGIFFHKEFKVSHNLENGWIKVIIYDPLGDRLSSLVKKIE